MRRLLAAVALALVAACSAQVGTGGAGGSGNSSGNSSGNGKGGDGGDAVTQDETSVGVDGKDGTSGVGIDIRIGSDCSGGCPD